MCGTTRRVSGVARHSARPDVEVVDRSRADRALLRHARAGDPVARERVVERYLGLVRSIARQYDGLGLPLEDLVQEGAIGLLAAIDRFDPENGASFPTYAFWRIRQAVTHALTTNGHILRLPKHVLENRRALVRASAALANAGRPRSIDELVAATGLSPDAVGRALGAPFLVASLDQPKENGTPVGSAIADPAAADPAAVALAHLEQERLAAAVASLPARQSRVIAMHFGLGREPQTLSEVARAMHVSPQRARAIEHGALAQLARRMRSSADGEAGSGRVAFPRSRRCARGWPARTPS